MLKYCFKVIITWRCINYLRIYRFYDFIQRCLCSLLTKVKVFIRFFFSVRNFAKKFSSCSCLLGVEFFFFFFFFFFFPDLGMSLKLLEYFYIIQILFDFAYSVHQVLRTKLWDIFCLPAPII